MTAETLPAQPASNWTYLGPAAGPAPGVRCDRPKLLRAPTGEIFPARCGTSDSNTCGPCAETYRKRVMSIAASGAKSAHAQRTWFLTFTAPGNKAHEMRAGVRCPCTPDEGVDLAQWNGRAVDRWNDLARALARAWGVERFEYFKAVEVQKRGALHLHVIVRLPAPRKLSKTRVRFLAIRHGYGHEVDVQAVNEAGAAAWYVAKYVAKASSDRHEVPYVHRVTGEVGPGRWRTWTTSRMWGESMGSLKRRCRDHVRLNLAPVTGRPDVPGDGGDGAPGRTATERSGVALDPYCTGYATQGIPRSIGVSLPV